MSRAVSLTPGRVSGLVVLLVLLLTGTARGDFLTWNHPPKSPLKVTEHRTYESEAMGTQVGYRIYLPPGYEEGEERYPVIYWLHGLGGSEGANAFSTTIIDEAVRERTIPPVIMVYPCGGRASWYADSPDGKWLAETTIIKELIPHIDATYRTIPTREGRAIQGMSMGGYGALKFAMKYPELFSSVVAFAPSLRSAEDIRQLDRRIFEIMFGGDADHFTAQHPETLIRENADALRDKVKIKLLMGTKDMPVLLRAYRKFHQALVELNIPHEYEEIDGINHSLRKLVNAVQIEPILFAFDHFGEAQGEQETVASSEAQTQGGDASAK